jgi:FkbM family methyltransferase
MSSMNESSVIFNFFKELCNIENPVMFDVGACDGSSFTSFLNQDWNVYAFEPHPERYKNIDKFLGIRPYSKLKLIKKAVNDEEKQGLTFYESDQSIGISSLTNFHNTHRKTSFKVDTIRLDNYMRDNKIEKVNFLKIDTEGHDFMVLKSYDWDKYKPDIIECEYEDLKTKEKLNYSWKDMAEYLKDKGYHIIISEWHPIVRYGIRHKWNCFQKYPCELKNEKSWGNFICFKDKEKYDIFCELINM